MFEIVFGMVHGQQYKGFQKISHILVPITCHLNLIYPNMNSYDRILEMFKILRLLQKYEKLITKIIII